MYVCSGPMISLAFFAIYVVERATSRLPSGSETPIAFKSPIVNKESVNFILIGDWGNPNNYNASLTGYEMGVYAWLYRAEFVIALGDNFYNDGVSSVHDSLWDSAFHDIYSSNYLQIPWFPVLGNHDYHQNASAQIARTKIDKGIWTMPDFYYVYSYKIPGGGSLCIVYIDTCLIDPYAHDTSAILDNPNWEDWRSEHLSWIEKVLAAQSKTATWLIVAGHYPVYSLGDSGDNDQMIELLLPLLKKYKVSAYLCGHDHNHQHIYKDGIHFFVDGSGGGRGPLGPKGLRHQGISAGTNYTLNAFVNCGFSVVEVSTEDLKVHFVQNLGNIRYTAVLDKPVNRVRSSSSFIGRADAYFESRAGLSYLLVLTVVAVPVLLINLYFYHNFVSSAVSQWVAPTRHGATGLDVSTRSAVSTQPLTASN